MNHQNEAKAFTCIWETPERTRCVLAPEHDGPHVSEVTGTARVRDRGTCRQCLLPLNDHSGRDLRRCRETFENMAVLRKEGT